MYPLTVDCPNCDNENAVNFEEFRELKLAKCGKCGLYFNVFDAYLSLYKKFPLVTKMVDVSSNYTFKKFNVIATKSEEKERIEGVLENSHFQDLLKRIFFDMILYGNSFTQIISEDQSELNRLEPTELEFKIDFVQEPPFKSFGRSIVEIRRRTKPTESYNVADILHFKGRMSLSEPIGDSILGFWFDTWRLLRMAMGTFLDMQHLSGLKEFLDFEESSVLGAAAIPHSLIFPWIKIDSKIDEIEQYRFRLNNERRRETVSRVIERKLFPKILQRVYEYKNFPRLEWQA
jgi:hypothetical protein